MVGDGQWGRGGLFEFCSLLDSGGGSNRWFQWKKDRGSEVKIRERREMGENRYDFEIYYFNVLYDKIKVGMLGVL